jgi:hypothetical protein
MAEPVFPGSLFPDLRQPLNELGALGYQFLDNVVGFDDNYDTTGELLGRSLQQDPIGTLGGIASGVVDSVKAAYADPLGTLSEMGAEFVTAFEMLNTPMDMDASRDEVGRRLEALSLLSSVIPVVGAGAKATSVAGKTALRGFKPGRADLETRSPDLIDEVSPDLIDEVSPPPVGQTPSPFDDPDFNPFDNPGSDSFDEPEFNPNAFDPEAPADDGYVEYVDDYAEDIDDYHLDPEGAEDWQGGPFDPEYTNPVPIPETLPAASFFPEASPYYGAPYYGGSAFASNPLNWHSSAAVAGLYSRSARAAGDLRQPTYVDFKQLIHELEARGAPPKELDLQMDDLYDLFEESPTGKVSAEEIQRVIRNSPGIEVVRTNGFAAIGPQGGQNYTSTVYAHPAVTDGPAVASTHFDLRKTVDDAQQAVRPLLHSRAAQYQITPDGAPAMTHHVLEIQSDWAQFRQALPADDTPEARKRALEKLIEQGRFEDFEFISDSGMTRPKFDEIYPAPFIKKENDWVDAGVRQNLLDAVNSGSEWITFGNSHQAAEHIHMPYAAAERFYDNQVPLAVERVLRKFSREAGIDTPKLQDVPFVDGQMVKGLRLTTELRKALIKTGLPSFRDGGMVTAGEHLLASRQY